MATDDQDENRMGYSTRQNGTCAVDMKNCGNTWDSFRTCCPGNTYCTRTQTGICCPTSDNESCTAAMRSKERCADPTADLYWVGEANYFCCANNTQGFSKTVDSSTSSLLGCVKAEDKPSLTRGVTFLTSIDPYTPPASISSSKPWPGYSSKIQTPDMVYQSYLTF